MPLSRGASRKVLSPSINAINPGIPSQALGELHMASVADLISRPPQTMTAPGKSVDSVGLPALMKQQQEEPPGKGRDASIRGSIEVGPGESDMAGSSGMPPPEDLDWDCLEDVACDAILQQQRRLARSMPALASTSAPSAPVPAAATAAAAAAAAAPAAPGSSNYADSLRLHDMNLHQLHDLMERSAAAASSATASATAPTTAAAASTEQARALLHVNAVRQAAPGSWDQPPPPPAPRKDPQAATAPLPIAAKQLVREGELGGTVSWDSWTATVHGALNGGHQHGAGAHGAGARAGAGHHKQPGSNGYKYLGPVERKLQQTLEAVRHNEDAKAQLEARLAAYRAADEPGRVQREALVRSNKLAAATATADSKLARTRELAEQRDERAKQVREQQREREQQLLAAKVLAAQRDQLRRDRKGQEEAARAALALRTAQAQAWGGMVRAAHTTQLLANAAVALCQQEQLEVKEQACITIQRFWRGYLKRGWFRKMMKALVIIQRAMKRRYGNDSLNRRRRTAAANTLLLFLKHLEGISPLQSILKRLHVKAARERRRHKQLDILRTAQQALVVSQWTALEARMLALARKRAGSDAVTAAGAKSDKPKRSRLAGTVEARRSGAQAAVRQAATAQQRTTGTGVSEGAQEEAFVGSRSVDEGPLPGQCHVSDKLLHECLEKVPTELKGLLAQVYLKMKRRAYIAVIGLHWRDVARYRREKRQQEGMAMARSILQSAAAAAVPAPIGTEHSVHSGSMAAPVAEKDEDSDVFQTVASASAVGVGRLPVQLRFRPTATLAEMRVLMQQAAAEWGPYMSFQNRQDAAEYRAQLMAELAARRVAVPTQDSSATEAEPSAAAPAPGSRRTTRLSLTGTESSPRPPALGAGDASSMSPEAAKAQAAAEAAATKDSWATSMLQRMEACLRKRMAMSNVNMAECLQMPAVRAGDPTDEELMAIIYAGAGGSNARPATIRE